MGGATDFAPQYPVSINRLDGFPLGSRKNFRTSRSTENAAIYLAKNSANCKFGLRWGMSCVDGSRITRIDLMVWRGGRVQSCVRPVAAVHMPAGPDGMHG